MTSCLICKHAALRDTTDADRDKVLRRMAAHGFVNCTASEFRATFKAFSLTCAKFAAAPAEVSESRRDWASKRRAGKAGQGEPAAIAGELPKE